MKEKYPSQERGTILPSRGATTTKNCTRQSCAARTAAFDEKASIPTIRGARHPEARSQSRPDFPASACARVLNVYPPLSTPAHLSKASRSSPSLDSSAAPELKPRDHGVCSFCQHTRSQDSRGVTAWARVRPPTISASAVGARDSSGRASRAGSRGQVPHFLQLRTQGEHGILPALPLVWAWPASDPAPRLSCSSHVPIARYDTMPQAAPLHRTIVDVLLFPYGFVFCFQSRRRGRIVSRSTVTKVR